MHTGADKMHIGTCFIHYLAGGWIVSGFDWIYIVTCEAGRCANRKHPERDADDRLLDHGVAPTVSNCRTVHFSSWIWILSF
jgi:hypothetical protein